MATDLGQYGSGQKPADEPPLRSRRRLTGRHLVAVPLVLLLVDASVLGARLHARSARDADPARVAAAFFDAVAGDRAPGAAALTRLPAGVDARFSPADLQAQGGITSPAVTAVTRHGDRTTVSVTYTLAGLDAHSELVLARSYDGLLHAPTWRIVGGLPVVHVRAAPFEPTATVDGRPVPLRRGSADVTVLPGLVQVRLAAHPPAGDAVSTVSATGNGTLVRFPPTLDNLVEGRLEGLIEAAVLAQAPSDVIPGGPEAFAVFLGDDGSTITFRGHITSAGVVDADGQELGPTPTVQFSGTAVAAAEHPTITHLTVSRP